MSVHIDIICLGNIRDDFIEKGIIEYTTRLNYFCNLNIIEIKEKPFKDSDYSSIKIALDNEFIDISSKISKNSFVIGLFIDGTPISSDEFAEKINFVTSTLCKSRICFIIGSSYGLSEKVRNLCDFKMSLSKMTFTHTMTRLFLLEQIYRAFCINNNVKYHK